MSKSKEVIVEALNKLTPTQIQGISNNIDILTKLKDLGEINETNLMMLSNLITELTVLRELYITRIINSLKRGDMV